MLKAFEIGGKLVVKVLQHKNEIYGSEASVDSKTQTLLTFSLEFESPALCADNRCLKPTSFK